MQDHFCPDQCQGQSTLKLGNMDLASWWEELPSHTAKRWTFKEGKDCSGFYKTSITLFVPLCFYKPVKVFENTVPQVTLIFQMLHYHYIIPITFILLEISHVSLWLDLGHFLVSQTDIPKTLFNSRSTNIFAKTVGG